MKRIALLIPTLAKIGGAERQVILLAEGLAARGWRVTVVALSGQLSNDLSARFATAKIEFLALEMRKAWFDPRGWLRFFRWCRKHQPAILHAHLPHAAWFARCFRLVHRIPVVLDTLHGSRLGSPRAQWLYRLTCPLTDQVTAVSSAVADAALAAKLVPAHKLSTVPNGIPLPGLSATNPEAPTPPPPFVWLAVGRLARVKDYPTLLRAFALLPSTAQLEIAGDGPLRNDLLALAEELRISLRVRWLGFCADVDTLYARAHALVLSSLWEGLPMCALEAAVWGLPVVATRAAGTNEAVLDGVSALLTQVGDARALSEAMARIMALTDRDREKMGLTGRNFVLDHYAMEAVLNTWERLYNRLLASAAHSPQ